MRKHSRVRHIASALLAATLAVGFATLDPTPAAASPSLATSPTAPLPHNLRFYGVMQAAGSVVGHPYRWGGAAPGGFDCSGLVRWAFASSGKHLPHSSRAQRAATLPIGADQAVSGDLVFFGNPVHHVGIYMGQGMMVHSPRAGDVVKISSIHNMGSAPHFGRVK